MKITKLIVAATTLVIALMAQATERLPIVNNFTKNERDSWKIAHYSGGFRLQVRKNDGSVTLRAPAKGKVVESYYRPFRLPKGNAVEVELELSTEFSLVPMVLAISTGPGAVTPAVKFYGRPPADGKAHKVQFLFDVTSLKKAGIKDAFFEIIIEAWPIPAGDLLTIHSIKMQEPVLQLIAYPRSGIVYDKLPDQNIVAAWKRLPADKAKLTATLTGQGVKLFKMADAKTKGQLSFDTSKLPLGNYTLNWFVGGKWKKTYEFRKLGMKNNSFIVAGGVPYHNGKPFFAIGMFHCAADVLKRINQLNRKISIPEVTLEESLGWIHDRGFNTVHHWGPTGPEYFKLAKSFGFLVLDEPHQNQKAIHGMANEKHLMGHYSWDEPSGFKLKQCAKAYKSIKSFDPYHAVFIAFNVAPTGSIESPIVDIAMLDPYPITGPDSNVDTMLTFLEGGRRNINRNDLNTCEYAVIQAFSHNMTAEKRFDFTPTPQQIRAEVFTSLVGGAKGIFYYGYYTGETLHDGMPRNRKRKHWFLPDSGLWDTFAPLNKELASYGDFVLLGKAVKDIALKGIPVSRVWKLGDKVLVLGVNPSGKKTLKGQIRYPAKKWQGKVKNDTSVTLMPYQTFTLLLEKKLMIDM